MPLLKIIKNALRGSRSSTERPDQSTSSIHVSPDDAMDAAATPLLLLSELGDDASGYYNRFWLMQYAYQLETAVSAAGIPIERYDWTTHDYPSAGGKFPRSETFLTHLNAFSQTNPLALHQTNPRTVAARKRTKFRTTEHTSAYLDKYFEHAAASREAVEAILIDVLDEYEDMNKFTLQDELANEHPEKYF